MCFSMVWILIVPKAKESENNQNEIALYVVLLNRGHNQQNYL